MGIKTMSLRVDSRIKLNNGIEIPILGLGTYLIRTGSVVERAVQDALMLGYRHIDTAMVYRNEQFVGKTIRESSIPREEIFVATKLWNTDHGYDSALAAFEKSLSNFKLEYIDLYLIHWPVPRKRLDSWRALETLLDDGKVRAIGVSNFTIPHLEELLDNSSVVPAINQVEFHPFLYQRELLEFCQSKGIQLEAYSPLTKGRRLNDPKLVEIAKHYNKTVAQLLIRWNIEHDVVVIPKSSKANRISENANVFDFQITPEDMSTLDSMNEDHRTSWDPTNEP